LSFVSTLDKSKFVNAYGNQLIRITIFLSGELCSKLQCNTFAFPVQFRSLTEEINVICLIDALNFGSGYRRELHYIRRKVRFVVLFSHSFFRKINLTLWKLLKGAYETICDGVISMMRSGSSLDTNFLCSISLDDVSTHFGIPIQQQQQQQQQQQNSNKRNELTPQISSLHQLAVLLQKVSFLLSLSLSLSLSLHQNFSIK
jgi:hypothetical protein